MGQPGSWGISRREALRAAGLLVLARVAMPAAAGCKRVDPSMPASCMDTTGLSDDARHARTVLGYVDASSEPGKSCSGCQQFIPPAAERQCGKCNLLKGPVHPDGYCNAFAARA